MSNLNKLNGWTGDGGYNSRTSAQSYMVSGSANMTSSGYGSKTEPLKLKYQDYENMQKLIHYNAYSICNESGC